MLKLSSHVLFALILSLAAMFLPSSVRAQTIPGTTIPTTVTQFTVTNTTGSPVGLAITLGTNGIVGCNATFAPNNATPGIEVLDTLGNFQTGTVLMGNPSIQGFTLNASTTYNIVNTTPDGGGNFINCLDSVNVSFAPLPILSQLAAASCPNGTFPNGVSLGEVTLNIPTSGGESVDISCVNGSNSILNMTITAPSGGVPPANLWSYDVSHTIPAGTSFSNENSWVLTHPANGGAGCDDNCQQTVGGVTSDRPLVFPFGCTQCNEFPNNGNNTGQPCGPAPIGQFCAAKNGLPPNHGCQANRSPNSNPNPTQTYGGTIAIAYVGPAVPPANCPGSSSGGGGKHTPAQLPKCITIPKKPITAKQLQEYYALKFRLLQELQRNHAGPGFYNRIYLPTPCPPGMMM